MLILALWIIASAVVLLFLLIHKGFQDMSDAMNTLIAEVTQMTDVATGAVTVIENLAAQIRDIRDSGATPEALTALAEALDASSASLGAAVAANASGGTA